jgi:hypothetical protein
VSPLTKSVGERLNRQRFRAKNQETRLVEFYSRRGRDDSLCVKMYARRKLYACASKIEVKLLVIIVMC